MRYLELRKIWFLLAALILLSTGEVRAQVSPPKLDGWGPAPSAAPDDSFLAPIALHPPTLDDSEEDEGDLPFYLGEKYRAQNKTVFVRYCLSVVGTTINFIQWDEYDWMWFALTVGGTLAFMTPTNPSLDVRVQDWIQRERTDALDKVFWRLTTERFTAFGLGFVATAGLIGWLGDLPDILEWSSLMLETLGIVQVHHIGQKLLIGRESPYQGEGLGKIHGPTEGYKLFPSGTPSGHTANVFALVTLTMDYFDKPWLDVIGYTFYAYICVSVLYNDQHFISDVIWGAPLGYFIGKWVVEHRSSKYRYVNGKPMRVRNKKMNFVGISPFADNNTGASGLTATWTW